MTKKIISITIALICLVGLISVASAGQVKKIGTGNDPAIYGSKVTWFDNGGSIHLYDISVKKDKKISSSKASYPAIYGNKLVWHDESGKAPRLVVYDIPSGARSYISQDVDAYSIPAFNGNRIVWSANDNVYMRDIATHTQGKVATGSSPAVYGNKIVYTHDSGDRPQVYVYDISTKKSKMVSSGGDLYNPHINGNKIIWSDFNTREGWIALFDISSKKEIAVTSDTGVDKQGNEYGCDTGTHNDIYGDKIVYAKTGNDKKGTPGVYVYSISKAKSVQLRATDIGAYPTPAIYGNTVVWGGADGNIFVCTI